MVIAVVIVDGSMSKGNCGILENNGKENENFKECRKQHCISGTNAPNWQCNCCDVKIVAKEKLGTRCVHFLQLEQYKSPLTLLMAGILYSGSGEERSVWEVWY